MNILDSGGREKVLARLATRELFDYFKIYPLSRHAGLFFAEVIFNRDLKHVVAGRKFKGHIKPGAVPTLIIWGKQDKIINPIVGDFWIKLFRIRL